MSVWLQRQKTKKQVFSLVLPVTTSASKFGHSVKYVAEDTIACLPANNTASCGFYKSVERPSYSSTGGTILTIWFLNLISLLWEFPWEIQVRTNLLTEARGSAWHPQPKMWKL